MGKLLLSVLLFATSIFNYSNLAAQGSAINSTGNPPDPSAAFDIDFPGKGLLIPRMNDSVRNLIQNPAQGLIIFNTGTGCLNYYYAQNWYQWCGSCIQPPAVIATASTPLCEGQTLQLSASNILNATYYWTGPNGFTSSLQNPVISNATITASGTYSVTATVGGCTGNPSSVIVTVNPIPSSNFSFTPNPGQINQNINFTPAVSGASYQWFFQSGTPATSTLQNPSSQWSVAGNYNVSLSVNSNGCSSDTTVISVPVTNCLHGSQTFSYTGSMQSWVVPPCIYSVIVDASGAQGGPSSGSTGGYGGRVQCTLAVNPGDVLNIYVGGQGGSSGSGLSGPGGYNGGGNAPATTAVCGGGGGASDIRLNGTALSNRVIVAGGGGGNGQGNGGAGGGLVGGQGSTNGAGVWATGGTQSAGGNGGLYNNGACAPGAYAQNGSLGQGGNGITGTGSCTSSGGSGGGGGYYGGGGMQINGAGGGSSYAGPGTSGVSHTQGYRQGNGAISITW